MLDLIKRHREVAVLASLPLEASSVGIVAGAYKGDTIEFLHGLYNMQLYGFEPQEWALNIARERFHGLANIRLYPYGIGTETGRFDMGEWGNDACSFVEDPAARTHGTGEMQDTAAVFDSLGLLEKPIDLAVFNLEGYEYKLLPYLHDLGVLRNIMHLVVQFHDMDRMLAEYGATCDMLVQTHRNRWEHANWSYWTWQLWERT